MNHHNLHAEVQTLQIFSITSTFISLLQEQHCFIQSVKMYYFILTFRSIKILTLRFKKPVLYPKEHTARAKEVYIF